LDQVGKHPAGRSLRIGCGMTPADFRAARLSLGLTPAQAATLLGYGNQSRISELEHGKRRPSATVQRLIQAYLDGYRPADWPKHDANAA
jgi:transcriptional regulator with XRE-family HTH domain